MLSLALTLLQADIELRDLVPHIAPAAGGQYILHHTQHNQLASLSAPHQSSAQGTDQVRHVLLHTSQCKPTKQSRCSQTGRFSANVLTLMKLLGCLCGQPFHEAHVHATATSVVKVHIVNLWLLTIQVEVQGDCDSLEEVYSQACLLTSHDAHCRDYYIKIQHLLAASSSVEQFQRTLQELIVPDMPFYLQGL